MIKTLKNAWRIPELKKKLLFTLFIVVLYRIGANIPVPFIDPAVVEGASAVTTGTILSFLDTLSGGALAQGTLLALGVSPYITASIVIQLLTVAIPALERWSKDGEEGKKKITALTRIVTIVLALITAIGYTFYLETALNGKTALVVENPNFFQYMIIVLCYCAGAALVMWMAEKINESGIGNGISIILFANIIASGATLFKYLWSFVFPSADFANFSVVGLIFTLVIILIFLALIMLVVWMSDAERRIPIQYAKRVVGRKMYGGQNSNLPIKVNMSGVMPIIFANSIVMLPATIASFMRKENWFTRLISGEWGWVKAIESDRTETIVQSLVGFNNNSIPFLLLFMILLIAFAYFYVMISFNPVEVANNIKNNGGAIPGIRSGRPTVDFIKKVLYRITMVGALLVMVVACLPMLLSIVEIMIGKTPNYFAVLSFGGSSLMIVVGVALETTRELEAQMTLRNYKGFLD